MTKPWENQSGYHDPTAYQAEKLIENEKKRASELMRVLKYVIRLAGFELIDRIELRDRRSGRTYR